jgi:imidazolonepropionase-like amidohydrolase
MNGWNTAKTAIVAAALSAAVPLLAQQGAGSVTAFTGARLLPVASGPAIPNGVLVVRDGRVVAAGPASTTTMPAGARTVDLSGRHVIPGLVAAHVHVSDINGLQPRAFTDANTARQLHLYARYGVTSLLSLGNEEAPVFRARDTQDTATLARSRVFVAGEIINAATPAAAREAVARVAATRPDILKIRVDPTMGGTPMSPDVFAALIDEAHRRDLRVAAHLFNLADAKALLRAGVDIVAHSVRDMEIDDEFITLMKARNVPYVPTLTREIATFVYESTPDFFSDPFFLEGASRDVIASLQEPARQTAMRNSASAQRFKGVLEIAKRNVKKASDAGVLIAMGTDSGSFPERFSGYFEHLEMAIMVEAGMTPAAVLESATIGAARALQRDDLGRLTPGSRADFVVLDADPLANILNTRKIHSVWIAGNQVDRSAGATVP